MTPLYLFLIILIIIVIIGMAAALIISDSNAKKNRNLNAIRGKTYDSAAAVDKKESRDKRRDALAKKLKEADENEDKKKGKFTTAELLLQAGSTKTVAQYWILSAVSCAIFTLIAIATSQSAFVTIMLMITGLLGIPKFLLRRKIKKRQKKFLEEFPDALEAMVRLLKSGMPVTEAISMAGREYTGPVGEEMLKIYDAQRVGISLPDATLDSAKRMPLTEMQMFATAIAIQTQTGASLSEVLINLSKVIRARFKLKRKVQALSSEAKASAGIIGSLPFLVGGGLWGINPEYLEPLITTTPGKIMMIGGAVWMGIGIMVMKIMINFKI